MPCLTGYSRADRKHIQGAAVDCVTVCVWGRKIRKKTKRKRHVCQIFHRKCGAGTGCDASARLYPTVDAYICIQYTGVSLLLPLSYLCQSQTPASLFNLLTTAQFPLHPSNSFCPFPSSPLLSFRPFPSLHSYIPATALLYMCA